MDRPLSAIRPISFLAVGWMAILDTCRQSILLDRNSRHRLRSIPPRMDIGDPILGIEDGLVARGMSPDSIPSGRSFLAVIVLSFHFGVILLGFGSVAYYPGIGVSLVLADMIAVLHLVVLEVVVLVADHLVDNYCIADCRIAFLVDSMILGSLVPDSFVLDSLFLDSLVLDSLVLDISMLGSSIHILEMIAIVDIGCLRM